MFNSFRNRVENFICRIISNPTDASRTVLASLLIVGMVAFTLDLSQQIVPEFFSARLLDPLDQKTWKKAKEDFHKKQVSEEQLKETEKCISDRLGEDSNYNKFLNKFENSFAGILPGAGNLLLEHPATVNNQKEKLIFEVMKNYSELKFCIPSDQFKLIYLAEYKNILGNLNVYFQVRLNEKDPSKYLSNEINPVFIGVVTQEFALVEKDLISTQKYVTDIVDRAIESAIELDRWTEQRLNNLTVKTNNKLTLGSNELIKTGNDIANENVKTNSANSFLLEQINKVLASIQPYPVTLGGAGVPSDRSFGIKYEGTIIESEVYIPNSDEINQKKDEASIRTTFGLLNLIDKKTREDFLTNRFGKDLVLYVAALNHIDPFVPGGSIDATAISPSSIASHLCSSIEIEGATCYSDSTISTSSIASSMGTTNDPDKASGISSESKPSATGAIGGATSVETSNVSDNVAKVNIVDSIPLPLDDTEDDPLWTKSDIIKSIPLPLDDTEDDPLWVINPSNRPLQTETDIVKSVTLPTDVTNSIPIDANVTNAIKLDYDQDNPMPTFDYGYHY